MIVIIIIIGDNISSPIEQSIENQWTMSCLFRYVFININIDIDIIINIDIIIDILLLININIDYY
jgi:hypothetical protein